MAQQLTMQSFDSAPLLTCRQASSSLDFWALLVVLAALFSPVVEEVGHEMADKLDVPR